MVVQAWDGISEDMIIKSFKCCGQVKNGLPDDITCLKEGHPASEGLSDVKAFWNKNAQEFASDNFVQMEEIDENEDPNLIEEIFIEDDSDDE